jgi:DNA-binding Lrp family transcriptional regulator
MIEKDILELLKLNSRLSIKEISNSLDISESAVASTLAELEKTGAIVQYTTVTNDEKLGNSKVRALIELTVRPEKKTGFDRIARLISEYPFVVDHYLISGRYDFVVIVEGNTIQDIANIVTELASIEHIVKTATHFMLKKYKEMGAILNNFEKESRLIVSP